MKTLIIAVSSVFFIGAANIAESSTGKSNCCKPKMECCKAEKECCKAKATCGEQQDAVLLDCKSSSKCCAEAATCKEGAACCEGAKCC